LDIALIELEGFKQHGGAEPSGGFGDL